VATAEASTKKPTAAPSGRKAASPRQLLAPVGLVAAMAALAGGIVYAIKTRPKADVAGLLETATALVERSEFEAAVEELNSHVLPVVNAGLGTPEDVAKFYQLRARSLYEAAAALGVSRHENFEAVIADYGSAREKGAALESSDVVRLATSLLEMGETDKALKEADGLPVSEADSRRKLVRLAVARNLEDPKRNFEKTLGLLVELGSQANIDAGEAAWTLARQGELLLGVGRGEEAVTKLLREMQLLPGLAPEHEAELREILGKAYAAQNASPEAARQYERVAELSDPVSERHSRAMVALGRIHQASGQLEQAKENFAAALEHSDGTTAYLEALAGRAAVLGALEDDEGAMADYSELIEKLPKAARTGVLSAEAIADDLMEQHADRLGANRTREALRYATMAAGLFEGGKTPANVMLALAASNRRLGDELLGRPVLDDTGRSDAPVRGVDAVTREEAKRCYLAAGRSYAAHAYDVVIEDVESASRSRWLSADSFDLAGDVEEAMKAFASYLQGAPGQDPRRQQAKYRLARLYQSTADYTSAAGLYLELLEERQSATERGGMVWAARSIVPLAQCLLADQDPANDVHAEQELKGVLSGREFTPQAEEFRDALLELGRYYYEAGRYPAAIERLSEARERFPKDPEIDRVKFRLADSERLSAGEIAQSLTRAMPRAQREDLEKTRRQRLQDASALFESVRGGLMARPAADLNPVERMMLRNATFYVGDCAYELEEYDGAIAAYDAARQQYDSDPSSLVALVQIVNAYVHQGEWAKAVTANERARQHLAKFPEEVWADPQLPMDKRHWERWLDSRSLLEQHARASAEAKGGGE
jgi:tetratricopeptide (TPR) repeat protein